MKAGFSGVRHQKKHKMASLILILSQMQPIQLAAFIAVVVVALLHVFFLIAEMFLWDKPFGFWFFKHPDLKLLEPKDPS